MTLGEFYKGKKVLVTGHTGFKGTWLCKWLTELGAQVVGYSLQPPTQPNLFELSGVEKDIVSIIGDIRDFDKLLSVFKEYQPEIVFHLAAQPIVRDSYLDPVGTYQTNVLGTVYVLECARKTESVKSLLNVTTDKVYFNSDAFNHAFTEDEPLDGFDPYSNSKSCSELVTHSYKKSFFDHLNCSVSTARAGNVIGGGDFANDRIIPDCVRAIQQDKPIIVRNPGSTRPYQHVLEPLFVYLTIAMKQWENPEISGYYNVGPDDCDCVTTGQLVQLFCDNFPEAKWEVKPDAGPHEAAFLKLSNQKIKSVFGWSPKLHIQDAVRITCAFTKVLLSDKSLVPDEMTKEIKEFTELL